MRGVSLLCAALALCLAGFAYWGLNTDAGRHAFDEMGGIVPLAAVPASFLLVLLAILFWSLAGRRGN